MTALDQPAGGPARGTGGRAADPRRRRPLRRHQGRRRHRPDARDRPDPRHPRPQRLGQEHPARRGDPARPAHPGPAASSTARSTPARRRRTWPGAGSPAPSRPCGCCRDLTVLENIQLGADLHLDRRTRYAGLRPDRSVPDSVTEAIERHRGRRPARPAARGAVLRDGAPRGDRPRARRPTAAAAARRADGGHEPAGAARGGRPAGPAARRGPDPAAHRARRADDGRHLRPPPGHEPGAADRRGPARRRRARARRPGGLPGRRGGTVLEISDLHVRYGTAEAVRGVSLAGGAGQGHAGPRRQRRRQDQHAARRRRPGRRRTAAG